MILKSTNKDKLTKRPGWNCSPVAVQPSPPPTAHWGALQGSAEPSSLESPRPTRRNPKLTIDESVV